MDEKELLKIIERIRELAFKERDMDKAHVIKRIADDLYGLLLKSMDDGK